MRFLAVVPRGLEPVCQLEIAELLKSKSTAGDGWVIFESKSIEPVFSFAYRAQSISKLLVLAGQSDEEITSLPLDDAFPALVNKSDFSPFFKKDFTFAGRACKIGEEDLPSPDIAAIIGGAFKDKTQAKVNLSRPDAIICGVIASDALFVGIDLCSDDLGKRPYRVFLQGQSIKAPLAYAIVRESGWTPKSSLLDPFCQAGTLPIEAALWATNTSPHKFAKERFAFASSPLFKDLDPKSILENEDIKSAELNSLGSITAMDDSFRSISSSKKNSKLAGVDKSITFSKLDVEWLDIKFGKNGMGSVATFPLMPNRLLAPSKIASMYKEFLYQSEYVLSKKGIISMMVKSLDLWSKPLEDHGFIVQSNRPVFQGKEPFRLIKIARK